MHNIDISIYFHCFWTIYKRIAEGWIKPTGTGLGKASTARNGPQASEQPKHTGCRPLPTNVDNAQPTRPPIGVYMYNELQLEKLINAFAAIINTAPIHGKRYWLRVDFWWPPPPPQGKEMCNSASIFTGVMMFAIAVFIFLTVYLSGAVMCPAISIFKKAVC